MLLSDFIQSYKFLLQTYQVSRFCNQDDIAFEEAEEDTTDQAVISTPEVTPKRHYNTPISTPVRNATTRPLIVPLLDLSSAMKQNAQEQNGTKNDSSSHPNKNMPALDLDDECAFDHCFDKIDLPQREETGTTTCPESTDTNPIAFPDPNLDAEFDPTQPMTPSFQLQVQSPSPEPILPEIDDFPFEMPDENIIAPPSNSLIAFSDGGDAAKRFFDVNAPAFRTTGKVAEKCDLAHIHNTVPRTAAVYNHVNGPNVHPWMGRPIVGRRQLHPNTILLHQAYEKNQENVKALMRKWMKSDDKPKSGVTHSLSVLAAYLVKNAEQGYDPMPEHRAYWVEEKLKISPKSIFSYNLIYKNFNFSSTKILILY